MMSAPSVPADSSAVPQQRTASAVDETIRAQLEELLAVRNNFARFSSVEEVARRALELAQERVPAQVFALFLLDKHGMLSRIAIRGLDREGGPITETWFSSERYALGESFTGRAAQAAPGANYGTPQWSNAFEEEIVKPESRQAYLDLLGHLASGVAIPLNGRYRTFGVLRVLNRRPADNLEDSVDFSETDVFWLAQIGNSLASAITAIRRQETFEVLAAIGHKLVVPFESHPDLLAAYDAIAADLVGTYSHHRAAIIRIMRPGGDLEVVGKAGDLVSWEGWSGMAAPAGTGLVGKVSQNREPIVIENIESELHRFRNASWISANRLRGFACFPLMAPAGPVGTLSLFSASQRFTPADRRFLETVASLIASFAESIRVSEALHALVVQAQEEGARDASSAAKVTLRNQERRLRDSLHAHKNDMYEIMRYLEEAEKGINRKKFLSQALQYAQASHGKLSSQLSPNAEDDAPRGVDINAVVTDLLTMLTAGHKKRAVATEARLGKNIPILVIDEEDVRYAIRNVLENAFKAVQHSRQQEQGRVVVTTEQVRDGDRDYVQISVEDNGIGIRREHEDRIFDAAFTTYDRGTGVGLFNTREIMRQYDGYITFTSSYGQGSTFQLRLPIRPYITE